MQSHFSRTLLRSSRSRSISNASDCTRTISLLRPPGTKEICDPFRRIAASMADPPKYCDRRHACPGGRDRGAGAPRRGESRCSPIFHEPCCAPVDRARFPTRRTVRVRFLCFDLQARRKFAIHSVELQHLWRTRRNTVIAGTRVQAGEIEARVRLDVANPDAVPFFTNPAALQSIALDFERVGVYAYDFFALN